MELSHILSKCDHTLLSPTATWAEIQAICDDGMKFKTVFLRLLCKKPRNMWAKS